jgi:hypothetical protein
MNTVNLAPADVKKEGAGLDLPIAVGILTALEGVSPKLLEDYIIPSRRALTPLKPKLEFFRPIFKTHHLPPWHIDIITFFKEIPTLPIFLRISYRS